MVIISINGGLGNQMFQYALFTKLQLQGKNVIIDKTKSVSEMKDMQRCTIFDSFILDKDYNINAFDYLGAKIAKYFVYPVIRRLIGTYHEQVVGEYDIKALEIDNGYLDGYWQTEKYFDTCREEILRRFTPKAELNKKNLVILNKIEEAKCPISIHMRLGDYNTVTNQSIFGDICTNEYYEQAIEYMKKKYDDPTFFLFSNDPNEAKKKLAGLNFNIVNINDENSGWADLYLMSKCHHNVIANSTFSWWGAWLNQYLYKEVIAPEKWMNTRAMPDICPEAWIRL